MKKSRFSVMALLAILFAAGSAFTAKVSMESKSVKQTSYYWYKVSGSSLNYQRFTTHAAEQPMSGCVGSGNNCEKGYEASQLNNPSQPSLGVKSTETANQKDIIVKN